MPLLAFGQRIENLVSLLAVVYASASASEDTQAVAALQAEVLKQKIKQNRVVRKLRSIEVLRKRVRQGVWFCEASDQCEMTQ